MLHRILASVALAMGIVLAYVGLYMPWHAMSQHAAEVKIGTLSIVLAPLAIVFSALYFAWGERVGEVIGHPDEAPGRLFIFMVALLALGVGAKVWMNEQARVHAYGPPVHHANVRLSMPLGIAFSPESLDAVDEHQVVHRVAWQDLESINITARPDDAGTGYTIYWELVGRDNFWTAIPLDAISEQAMLSAIRQHAGPIQRDPVKDMKETVRTARGRATWTQVVWTRR